METRYEPLVYYNEPDRRVVDLRPEGVSFVPLASRTICRTTRSGPTLHVHRDLTEISYCARGLLSFETPSRVYPFLPGDVFVSGANQPHALRLDMKGSFVYRLLVEWPRPGECLQGLTAEETAALAHALKSPRRRLFTAAAETRPLFDRLFALLADRGLRPQERRMGIRLCALELLLSFATAIRRDVVRASSESVRDWIGRMTKDPMRTYDVESMAREARMSATAFRTEFKRAAGLPPHAYLIVSRIEAAKRLAERDPQTSPTKLAMEFGFSSVPHFAMAFKRVTGCTFSEWQRRRTD